MEQININGIELAYDRHGSGTPLVLLHGYPLDHQIWESLTPLLKDTFDIILPDLRGFGSSTTVNTTYTMNDFASDIAGLLDHLGIQKTAIAGHSMGGYAALAFARLYPDRVGGLGLVSSQALADPPDRREGRYKSAAEVAEKGINDVVESMTPKFTPDKTLQAHVHEIMARQHSNALMGALKAMAERADSSALLSAFKSPVVIVHGDTDTLIPIERAREAQALIPHAHFVELKGVGHVPMMEASQATAEALRNLSA